MKYDYVGEAERVRLEILHLAVEVVLAATRGGAHPEAYIHLRRSGKLAESDLLDDIVDTFDNFLVLVEGCDVGGVNEMGGNEVPELE